MSKGVVYIATGEKYISEAIFSATQLKKIMPSVHVTIFSDQYFSSPAVDSLVKINDPQFGFIDKVKYIKESPYDKTLFLDTDTYVVDELTELFKLLDTFEIAAPYAPIDDVVEGVPKSFQEMNTGVILFRNTSKVKKCFLDWLIFHQRECEISIEEPPDQLSFREAVYKNKLHHHLLAHEYNCMISFPVLLHGRVSIFHGRNISIELLAEKINEYSDYYRIFHPVIGIIFERDGVNLIEHLN
ncbi:hypothetical protein BSK49_10800 [Paenibacillus odorifer]|uniref:hypothetical protein n=1 Tax=Paenibacillus TaxID=44249 RepID=UPI00096E2EE6|nr:hypothetical protein [Paenibacillus odorifer]OMD89847.1 hypothetical protein BSK49_10800 [Paenibacillus odorifer]OMD95835.1 hypothetical protein BSK64_29495 [Paenibacillus odorifer]